MIRIVVDDEQAKAIAAARHRVEACDGNGKVLGVVKPTTPTCGFSAEEIAEAKRRLAAPGPRYTTEQVLEHLRSLETR